MTIRGYDGASLVLPILSDGTGNEVSGNTALGTATTSSSSADGNVVVTFDQTIDRIEIDYGSGPDSPSNPTEQFISIHDLSICTDAVASGAQLDVSKVSTIIEDPLNGTTIPKALSGALVEYIISVSNNGTATTEPDTVVVTDFAPSETKFCLVDLAGGGPITFIDGRPSLTLGYDFSGVSSAGDDLFLSADSGASYNYVPVIDVDGCGPAITNFQIRPSGGMAASSRFFLRARFRIK